MITDQMEVPLDRELAGRDVNTEPDSVSGCASRDTGKVSEGIFSVCLGASGGVVELRHLG